MNCDSKLQTFSQKMKLPKLIDCLVISTSIICGGAAFGACLLPQRPFLPNDKSSMIEYESLIKADFEDYFAAAERYFQCLDRERREVFEEAQAVSQEFGTFLRTMEKD